MGVCQTIIEVQEKKVMKTIWALSAFFVIAVSVGLCWAQSSDEAAGKVAELAGKLREALTHYVAALQSVPEGNADDQRLRETIIKLVQKLSPPPAITEEARRFSVRGQTSIKEAKNPSDFEEAAKEFAKAVRVAPWWADGYINQGVALEKAGKFSEAIRSLKLYLLAAPAALDADKVKEQIYALEVRGEKAQKEVIAKKEEQDRKRREEETKASDPARLTGDWCASNYLGCGWKTKVSGSTIEFLSYQCFDDNPRRGGECRQKTWQVVFRGDVRGNEIAGEYFPAPHPALDCPGHPMTGKVLGNDRLQLTFRQPRSSQKGPSGAWCPDDAGPQSTTTFTRQ